MWTTYTQTYYGDPEMPGTAPPKRQELSVPGAAVWGATLGVTVRHLGSPATGHTVTVVEETVSGPRLLGKKQTGSDGRASFVTPSNRSDVATLQVTATAAGFVPELATIVVTPPPKP